MSDAGTVGDGGPLGLDADGLDARGADVGPREAGTTLDGGASDGRPPIPGNPDGAGVPSSGAAHFFLPTDEPTNTSAPTIEVDSRGGIHAVYPAYTRSGAYYAYCPANCSGPEQMRVVRFESVGTVHNIMLALDAQDRPRVLYSSGSQVHYASCDADCTDPTRWKSGAIYDHHGDREVTGEALALLDGRPRFVMHTYRALLGIGQKPPQTFYAQCDSDCEDPSHWQIDTIAEQIWEGSHLRFDGQGRAHLATVADVFSGSVVSKRLAAYVRCDGDCAEGTSWIGAGLQEAYEQSTAAVAIQPSVSLALTKAGNPRILLLGKDAAGHKDLDYYECDADCNEGNWYSVIISNHADLASGLDLALDAHDRPRLVYNVGYNIGMQWCDDEHCARADSKWDAKKIEGGSDMKPDEIILWPNCTVAAWFLHDPSIALTPDGQPRVGYQARDISGGTTRPDPTKPACVAGTDMTWSRMTILPTRP